MNQSPGPSQPSPLDDLPHGPEFRFVTAVNQLEPGKAAAGHYQVRGDESFLAGHFPGRPMMPGVILIEALAQLGGIAAQSCPEHGVMDDLRLTAVRQCKILGSAIPGDRIDLTVTISGRMGGLVQVSGSASVTDQLICRAELVLSGQPRCT